MSKRIHVIGVPHTVANDDYTVCAFTAKVQMFPDVIQPFGWEVVEYSNAGSTSNAIHHVEILTSEDFRRLSKRQSRDEPHDVDVANIELQQEFHNKLISTLKGTTWAQPGDIVCHVWGPNIDVFNALPECHHIESSVGYSASPGLSFRVYETSAWMHFHYGKTVKADGAHNPDGHNYKWVVPAAFETEKWRPREEPGDYVLFLGRVTARKGINIILDIARRTPNIPFRIYGPGDVSRWSSSAPPNLEFLGPVFGSERVEVVRNARCMLMPTQYIEPFGNAGIESQLCGAPLISSSFGAFQETVIDGVTGFRCHTLADYVRAIELSASLDRFEIAALARKRYSQEAVGRQYDWIFRQIQDLSGAGWYSTRSRKFAAPSEPRTLSEPQTSKIYIFLPYFGQFPNYFQIYLDSLAMNTDMLVVFLLTDIDLSPYRLPRNLILIPMTFDVLRRRIASFFGVEFGISVTPEDCIEEPYKLVDFKPLYPKLFQSVLDQYGVTADDFVGWGDCDLVYGKFSDFIETLEDFHVIGGFHGHFTAFRNVDSFKNLFTLIEGVPDSLLDSKIHLVDEVGLRQPLMSLIEQNHYRMFYINRFFCDIVPPCYYHLFRPDHASWEKNFFDAYNPTKNISRVLYGDQGKLTVIYDDGSERQCVYCHLQKRPMEVNFDAAGRGFTIRENSFEQVW